MTKEHKYLRFTISDRIEHWVQMASFTILGFTGLIQKFADSDISVALIALLGGIEAVRIIHRIASIGLMLGTIYHLGAAGYKFYVKRSRITMLPTLRDITNAWGIFLYNLKMRTSKPQQGRYTFDEKFEYWAFVWGTAVMGLTGFILWNPIVTAKFLPGIFIPAAKAAHSGEALLAVLAIAIWHFYNVHIKHLNKSMFTGYLSEHEMLEEHPIELADIKAGIAEIPQDPAEVAKRKRIFFPIYSVVAVGMLVGVYFFVRGEETAVTTVPPAETLVVFAPLTPTPLPTPIPTPTPQPTPEESEVAEIYWDNAVLPLAEEKCGACHGPAAMGGLDISSYGSTVAGGASGPAVVPGDPDASLIVTRQTSGDHPGQFSQDEINLITDWINAGAPENAESPTEAQAAGIAWDAAVLPVVEEKCGACHGPAAMGGLDLTNLESAIVGGDSGPSVVPGDPDASLIVTRQTTGDHPGQFSQDELNLVIDWINAGAPEE